jgi:formylglycine-generating enzyme required for sulfatase activity
MQIHVNKISELLNQLSTYEFKLLDIGKESYQLPRLLHLSTGLIFKLIPSGEYHMGFSEKEEFAARNITNVLQANIEDMRPVHLVKVKPFLITEMPILNMKVCEYIKLKDVNKKDMFSPAFLNRNDVDIITNRTNLRLPTEIEWEYCCRAGSESLFTWGNFIPEDRELERWLPHDFESTNNLNRNAFGLLGMFTGEWCEDKYRWNYNEKSEVLDGSYVIRGGGAYFWPWQDEEWVWCMSAMRMPSKDLPNGQCGFRLTYSLSY